jgi:TolB-like protein/cytochrome c-type biogenesis protein CcmH/NrfG
VTVISLNCWSESDQEAIRHQLDRILNSSPFHQSHRRQRFLEYLVNETLAGRGERLKGYTIALEVFDRPETFDPTVYPLVRIEAARLREKLREYYGTDGQGDPIYIDLPKGTYTPQIEFRQAASPDPWPYRPDAPTSDRPFDPSQGTVASQPRARKTSFGVLATSIAAVLLVLFAGFSVWKSWTPPAPLSEKASIAVLPFENIGNDPKWDRFTDGVTEDIVTDLSHSKDLFVVARNSTEVYRGKPADMRNVGRDLGVRYVLKGSIQPLGDKIRVTAQLIDTQTGGHVWSNRYDRPLKDIFAIQDEVTEKVAGTLTGWEGAIAEAERAVARRKPPANLQAYDYYLLGIEAKHKETKDDNIRAQELFRKALELDPRFARAYTALALTYGYEIWLSYTESRARSLRDWLAAVQKAVALDPYDGEAHMVLGYAYRMLNDHERATRELDRGLELQPNSPDLLMLYVENLPMLGNPQKGVELAERAIRLNPNYPAWYLYGLHRVYYFAGEFEKALAAARQAQELSGPLLAAIYGQLGRNVEAAEGAANVLKLDPDWSAERDISDTGAFARQAELDLYLDGIRKAGLPVCASATALQQRPEMKQLPICEQARGAL